jgi:hypothetical protein
MLCGDAMAEGIRHCGDNPIRLFEDQYTAPVAPVCVFYGFSGRNVEMFEDYRKSGTAVYVDLGYFGRREGGRWSGYHKVVVNSRHPNEYFQRVQHDSKRREAFRIRLKKWSNGEHILLAGMGDKGAQAVGLGPNEWERGAITRIRKFTSRRIIYRPKPSWKRARPLPGAEYAPSTVSLESVLENCHAVVTRHSNVAVDGLVAGVPAFVWGGVAMPLGLQDLSLIETPLRPEGREQWLNDICYTQWSVAEMRLGQPWRHLKQEGLICP